jgi:hypothetical protein
MIRDLLERTAFGKLLVANFALQFLLGGLWAFFVDGSLVSIQFSSQTEGLRTQVASVLLQIKVLPCLVVLQGPAGGKVNVAHRAVKLLVVRLHVRPQGFPSVFLAAYFTNRLLPQCSVCFCMVIETSLPNKPVNKVRKCDKNIILKCVRS